MTVELVATPRLVPTTALPPPAYSEADWQLDPATIDRLVEAIPASTRRAYVWAVRDFALWCSESGRVALPATKQTLTAYVDYLIEIIERAPASVEHIIGALRAWHKRNEYPHQPDTTDAIDLLRGYRRRLAEDGVQQRQAVPFTKATLHECIDALDLSTLPGRRTHMVLVFGFTMMARRRVLARLRFADITEGSDGLDVLIRTDKTDKKSTGRVCSLPPQSHPDGDPVRVLHAWREQLAAAGGDTNGPLLCRFSRAKNPRPLGGLGRGDAINDMVRDVTKAAQIPEWERHTAHALRAGGLVDALQRGVPPGIAARHGGWDPESPMLGRYARVANRWRDNAMRGAL